VHELTREGHEVFVEKDAGVGSSLPDEEFTAAGAKILLAADDVWGVADMVLKVKEPVAEEYHRMREGLVLFTYLHLAADRPCTQALLDNKVTSIAYEIENAVLDADLVIGAVLVPGAKAPTLISNDLVARMKPGSVLVDISIDQGGCFEDSRPTTHADQARPRRGSRELRRAAIQPWAGPFRLSEGRGGLLLTACPGRPGRARR
jgi:alanine dehydrogenase